MSDVNALERMRPAKAYGRRLSADIDLARNIAEGITAFQYWARGMSYEGSIIVQAMVCYLRWVQS